jgi:predicted transcriptional regulator
MKYRQLTKEQFEELHIEFARFLASQKIDAKEWKELKSKKPELAEEEMNVFSDVVWEQVLDNANFVEHFSKQSINLFKTQKTLVERILIKTDNPSIDFQTKEGISWLMDNASDKSLSYFFAHKNYAKNRNLEIFDLIEKGAVISKGDLYLSVARVVKK